MTTGQTTFRNKPRRAGPGVKTGTAVGYFRVSTTGQAGERHVSLEVQEDAFTEYCRRNQLHPLKTFTDIASGRKDDRVHYQAMLAWVKEHGVANIVVYFLDRFGRNSREILRRYWELDEQGIAVQSINEDLREEVMLLMRSWVAGQDSKRTGERVRDSIRKAVMKRTYVVKVPFGYIKIRDQNGLRIEQVLAEAAIVRLAYELATVRNMGFKRMADELNRLGYRRKSGSVFTSGSLRKSLMNPALAGTQEFGKRCVRPDGTRSSTPSTENLIVNEGFYPAILSAEEWAALQERFAIRGEGSGHRGRTDVSPFLLSGILKCGHCQKSMSGKSSGLVTAQKRLQSRLHKTAGQEHLLRVPCRICGEKFKNNQGLATHHTKRHLLNTETPINKYYVCLGKVQARELCTEQKNHNADRLEAAFLQLLPQYKEPDAVHTLLQAQAGETDTRAETELKAITIRLNELERGFLNDLERVDREIMTEAEYLSRQEARRREQDGLKTRHAELEATVAAQRSIEARSETIPCKVRKFLDNFAEMEITERKATLQGIIKTVDVYSDGRLGSFVFR